MRVAVFRAEADGRRTAAHLSALGHKAVVLPVLRIVPTGLAVPAASTDGLIFTSAQAPDMLSRHPAGTARWRALPCWCVGERTAQAARAAGFGAIESAGGDGLELARAILARGGGSHFTLVAGRDRKPDLERALGNAGVTLAVVEVYAAEAIPAWSADQAARLATAAAALHYSRRSAALASRLAAAADCGAAFRGLAHHCLSADVAAGLEGVEAARISVAARPDEEGLFATLGRLAKATGSR